MSTAELNDDFRDVLSCLEAAGVEYVIVGAHALAAHGIPRATGDITGRPKDLADVAELERLSAR